jgi:glc operon protein GlcG
MRKLLFIALTIPSIQAFSQTTPPAAKPGVVAYGQNISLENAKKIATSAEAYAESKQYTIIVAIVDTGGNLVLLQRMDNTQIGSIEVAIGKAKTSNNFKRPTKAMEDAVAAGGKGLRVLALPVFPIDGGEPIIVDGKIIGAIGISGMSAEQDDEVAKAALVSFK